MTICKWDRRLPVVVVAAVGQTLALIYRWSASKIHSSGRQTHHQITDHTSKKQYISDITILDHI